MTTMQTHLGWATIIVMVILLFIGICRNVPKDDNENYEDREKNDYS